MAEQNGPPVREVILHIGRHKSGTTALQHWAHANRDRLAAQGLTFPHSGSDNRVAHHLLVRELRETATDAALAPLAGQLRAEAADTGRLLLSSEAFQNVRDVAPLRRLLVLLGQPEVRVLCYLREHLDYAQSGWRQMVQNQTRFVTFADYSQRFAAVTPFLERWRSIGSLDLAWYHRSLLREGDIVADVCHRLGLDRGSLPTVDRNPSIGGNLLIARLAANRLGRDGGGYAAQGRLAGSEPRFRQPFRIPKADAERLRAASDYNRTAIAELGPVPMTTWDDAPDLPDTATLDTDLDHIGAVLGVQIDDAWRSAARDMGPALRVVS